MNSINYVLKWWPAANTTEVFFSQYKYIDLFISGGRDGNLYLWDLRESIKSNGFGTCTAALTIDENNLELYSYTGV